MKLVIAPDACKGSATATEVAAAIAAGWQRVRADDEVVAVPLADGGEGTAEVLAAAYPGARWMPCEVAGPDGRRHEAAWLLLPDGTAVVELAAASGLPLLEHLDPTGAHTVGVGELIADALDHGVDRVTIALGGSASVDGGSGALAALGARFLDAEGRPLPRGGGALAGLARLDTSALRPPPPGGVTCLVDVRAPLLGPVGAARAFGPQKGADEDQVAALETSLATFATVAAGLGSTVPFALPGAGAAGGAGFGFAALWGADLVPGADAVADAVGISRHLEHADLVVTGEGAFDATSLQGKVVGTLLASLPGHVVAGLVVGKLDAAPPPRVTTALSLTELAGGAEAAMADPKRWLEDAGARLATEVEDACGPRSSRRGTRAQRGSTQGGTAPAAVPAPR